MHYPFHPTVTPGAPRPDFAHMITRHGYRVWHRRAVAMIHADSMVRETYPENSCDTGTELRRWAEYADQIASADCAAGILIRHRRMAHRAFVRSVENVADYSPVEANAAERAWECARRYCGLPT